MNKITLYHNPRCSKSRAALALLETSGNTPEIRLYLEQAPDRAELQAVLQKLAMQPRELLRTGEAAYKELGLADTSLSNEQILDAMIQAPKLIERPIAVTAETAVIGRPPENVLELV